MNTVATFQCLAETLEPGPEAQIAWECDNLLAQTAEESAQLDEALKTAQDGFAAVTVTTGSRDYGADILAERL